MRPLLERPPSRVVGHAVLDEGAQWAIGFVGIRWKVGAPRRQRFPCTIERLGHGSILPVPSGHMIRVGVFGAGGRMGATVCDAVHDASGMDLVAAVDPFHEGGERHGVRISPSPDAVAAANADVCVDFTIADAARENLRWCAANDVHAVVGTTGFGDDDFATFGPLFAGAKANAVIAPNFAIGAVLMIRFAELAAPFFDSAEIIELHHENKIDAPSGTAIHTAQRMAAASKEWLDDPTTKVVADGARGGVVDGIPVHAVRLRGFVAHSRGRARHERPDTVDSPRHDRPLVVHAGRAARHPQHRRHPGPHRRFGPTARSVADRASSD